MAITKGEWRAEFPVGAAPRVKCDGAMVCERIGPYRNTQEAADNARLIAAAPFLLGSHQSIIEWTDDEPPQDSNVAERGLWYSRRLLMIRNASRAAMQKAGQS